LVKALARLLLAALFFTPAVFAQETREWEFFGGYSFEAADVREYYKSTPILYTFRDRYVFLNGWEASVTENANHWLGGTLQLTGHFASPVALGTKNKERLFSILYGPRFSRRSAWGALYGHILFGAAHTSVTVSPGPHASDTDFAVAAGGGLDMQLGNRAAVRVLQLQYSPTNPVGARNHTFQASAGVVFYVGKAR
jgi:hypothetical protein